MFARVQFAHFLSAAILMVPGSLTAAGLETDAMMEQLFEGVWYVLEAPRGSLAADLRLEQGDIITQVNGKPAGTVLSLDRELGRGGIVTLKVHRAGKVFEVTACVYPAKADINPQPAVMAWNWNEVTE